MLGKDIKLKYRIQFMQKQNQIANKQQQNLEGLRKNTGTFPKLNHITHNQSNDKAQRNQYKHFNLLNDIDDSTYKYPHIQSSALTDESPNKLTLGLNKRKDNPVYTTFSKTDKNNQQQKQQNEQSIGNNLCNDQTDKTFEIKEWSQKVDQYGTQKNNIKKDVQNEQIVKQKLQTEDQKWQRLAIKSHKQQKQHSSFKQKIQNVETKNLNVKCSFAEDGGVFSPNSANKQTPSLYQSECFMEINNKKWQKVTLKLNKFKLCIGPICIDLDKILKCKIFTTQLSEQSKQSKKIVQSSNASEPIKVFKKNTIKISVQDGNNFQFYQMYPAIVMNQNTRSIYSPSTLPQAQNLVANGMTMPLPYLTICKIILKKIKQLYPNTKATQWQIPDFLPRATIHENNTNPVNKYNIKNYVFIHGAIYKKSQHKGNWQKRYIIINENGIYSYKNQKDEHYSFFIETEEVKYMWTWFNCLKVDKQKDKNINNEEDYNEKTNQFSKQITNQLKKTSVKQSRNSEQIQNKNSYLIVKLKHGFNGQTQFAIPICGFDNFLNKNKNWLFAFYRVLSKDQN